MIPQSLPKGIKAMIFAAGLGTRLKPFTDLHPKALFPIHGKTLLQRNIEHLKSFGIEDIIINVHHFAEQIFDFIHTNNQFGININFSHEIEEALETGGGLKKASWFFTDTNMPFVVINADILSTIDLYKMYTFHTKQHGIATLAATSRNSSRVLIHDSEYRLVGWKNLKTGEERIARADNSSPSTEVSYPNPENSRQEVAFSGIHIINPDFIKSLQEEGKFSIIDSYLEAAKSKDIFIYRHDGDLVVDVGKPESVAIAEKMFPV